MPHGNKSSPRFIEYQYADEYATLMNTVLTEKVAFFESERTYNVYDGHLLYDKLREWAVCGEFCVLIGYPSGQDGAILPARDFPFCSRNNISPKSKRVHESFLSQTIFRDSKKIFCDLFVGMELENEKTETCHHFCV